MSTQKTDENKAIVTGCEFLTVRAGPSVKHTAENYLAKGTTVDLIGDCSPNGWHKIRVGKIEGWVNADYLNFGGLCK